MLACYNITSQLHYITPAFITARAGSSSGHNIILSQLHSAICTCSPTPVMESSRYVDIQPCVVMLLRCVEETSTSYTG